MSPPAVCVKAPGKINLCLFLGGVLNDGRHELVTVLESVSLADELLAIPGPVDELVCAGVVGPNLAYEALGALRARGWEGPPLRIEIEKRLPVAAGMGGGSADAAAVLRLASALAPVPGGEDTLEEIARSLGADVPSQLRPGVWLGTGAGEVVELLAAPPKHAVVIVPSPERLSTAAVYHEADRLGLGRAPGELAEYAAKLRQAFSSDLVSNDLQPAALSLCPSIVGALEQTLAAGADQALVCGSGPTVAGLFWGPGAAPAAHSAAAALSAKGLPAISVHPVDPSSWRPHVAHPPREAQSEAAQ